MFCVTYVIVLNTPASMLPPPTKMPMIMLAALIESSTPKQPPAFFSNLYPSCPPPAILVMR